MITRKPIPLTEISLLILAGGRGSRMGGQDKGLMDIAGRPAVEHILERFAAHPGQILISANRNIECYAAYGYPVIEDASGDFHGPLAGMLAGLRAAPDSYVLTLPVDAPLISSDYPVQMAASLAESGYEAGVASVNQHIEPVFCLLKKTLAPALQDYLDRGRRTVNVWLNEVNAMPVDFSDAPQQFINLNVAQDRERLHKYLAP